MYKSWVILILAVCLIACQTSVTNARDDVVGVIDSQTLLARFPQFKAQYLSYQPSALELQAIKHIQGKRLVVLFGTWCHDSEREVPRLLKTLALANVKLASLQLLGVGPNKELPGADHQKFRLRYTPTFILFDAQQELGRIIERPQRTLAEDLEAMLPVMSLSILMHQASLHHHQYLMGSSRPAHGHRTT